MLISPKKIFNQPFYKGEWVGLLIGLGTMVILYVNRLLGVFILCLGIFLHFYLTSNLYNFIEKFK